MVLVGVFEVYFFMVLLVCGMYFFNFAFILFSLTFRNEVLGSYFGEAGRTCEPVAVSGDVCEVFFQCQVWRRMAGGDQTKSKSVGRANGNGGKGKIGKQPEAMIRMDYLYRAAHSLILDGKQGQGKQLGPTKLKKTRAGKPADAVAVEEAKDEIQRRSRNSNARRVLSTHLSQLMVGIGRKAVLRASTDVKRTICKGCRNILVPGINCRIVGRCLHSPKKEFASVCKQCGTKKRLPLKKRKEKTS